MVLVPAVSRLLIDGQRRTVLIRPGAAPLPPPPPVGSQHGRFLTPQNTGCRIPLAELTPFAGTYFADLDGTPSNPTIVSGLHITGNIRNRAKNIIFRDCVIDFPAGNTAAYGVILGPTGVGNVDNAHAEYLTIRGNGNGAGKSGLSIGVDGTGYVQSAKGCYVTGWRTGIKVNSDTVLSDTRVDGTFVKQGDHATGISVNSSQRVRVQRCYSDTTNSQFGGTGVSSAISMYVDTGPLIDTLVEDSFFETDAFFGMYWTDHNGSDFTNGDLSYNNVVRSNVFGNGNNPNCGRTWFVDKTTLARKPGSQWTQNFSVDGREITTFHDGSPIN